MRNAALIGIAAGALIAICALVAAGVLEYKESAAVLAATQVRTCMRIHHLETATQSLSSCHWPPYSWADQDGYTEIKVKTFAGPGAGEASDANEADYITAPCHRVELAYDFESQGVYQFLPPFVASVGMVTSEDHPGQAWHGPKVWQSQLGANLTLALPPRSGAIVYIHNDNQGLFSARCVS